MLICPCDVTNALMLWSEPRPQAGRKVKLGKHAKAVDAAVEYAKHVLDKMLQT